MKKLLLMSFACLSLNSNAYLVNESEVVVNVCGTAGLSLGENIFGSTDLGVNLGIGCMVSSTTTSLPTVLIDDLLAESDFSADDFSLKEFEMAYKELSLDGLEPTREEIIEYLK